MAEFESVKEIAENCESEGKILAVLVRWIGWDVDMGRKTELDVYNKVRWEAIKKLSVKDRLAEDQEVEQF